MPILSVIMFFLLIYIMVRKNSAMGRYADLFVIYCTVKIYWFQGYFLKIGNNEISSIANISSHLLLLYSIYLVVYKKIKIDKTTLMSIIFFVSIICLGMMYEKIFPYDGLLLPEQNDEINWDGYIAGTCSMYQYIPPFSAFLRPLWQVLEFSFEVLVFKQIYEISWFVNSYMKIIGYLKYGIYYGYFEFLLKNIIGNLTITYDFAAILLGVNEYSVYTEAYIKDGLFYTLQGLTREPSHFNCFLFNVAVLMMLGNIMKRIVKNKSVNVLSTYSNFTICACIGLMLLTGGFSSIWYLFIIGGVALLLRIRESGGSILDFLLQKKITMFSFFIICSGIVFAINQNDYLYNRLIDAMAVFEFLSESNGFAGISILGGNSGIGSTIARFVSIYEGIIAFVERPLLGLSWCVQPVHDFSITLLSNIGILGVYFLYKVMISSIEKKRYDFSMIFLIFIIGGLPITISSSFFALHWLLFFEVTSFYMNYWDNDNVSS